MKCKNCGHDLIKEGNLIKHKISAKFIEEQKLYCDFEFKYTPTKTVCGCTKPEEEKTK